MSVGNFRMLSFIIPAHNEEAELPATLEAIHAGAATLGLSYEIVVANDSSTDGTAEVAKSRGARVIDIGSRHIAAARNAGWKGSTGDRLIFVDADTRVTPRAIAEAVEAMEQGAMGGGGPVTFDGYVPLFARVALPFIQWSFRLARLTGGCFFFTTRNALETVGGWPERVFAGEEVELAKALKAEFGRRRFVVVRSPVQTSGRKLRTYSVRELLGPLGSFVLHGRKAMESRDRLALWYGERREDPRTASRVPTGSTEKSS